MVGSFDMGNPYWREMEILGSYQVGDDGRNS